MGECTLRRNNASGTTRSCRYRALVMGWEDAPPRGRRGKLQLPSASRAALPAPAETWPQIGQRALGTRDMTAIPSTLGSHPELPKSDAALLLACPEDIPGALSSAACARCLGLGAAMAGAKSPSFSPLRLLLRCRGRSDGAATRHLWLRSRYPSFN